MTKNNKLLNIILIVSIILIIHGITQTGSEDKKTAQAGQTEVVTGTMGLGATTLFKKQFLPAVAFIPGFVWVIGGILTIGLVAPGIIGNIVDIFRPAPAIPSWVWIAGFAVLALMAFRKK